MAVKIAVITDLHFSRAENTLPERQGEFADTLLLRTIHRLNRFIKPDLVFIGGDLLNEPNSPDAEELLRELKKQLDLLTMKTIIIPGNHDPAPEIFYRIFDRPAEYTDINGCRFVAFCDPEMPGFNARREPCDLNLMRAAGTGFSGPLVSLQHVPLCPPESGACPYNYTNAAEIIRLMRENGYCLALSGHHHAGFQLTNQNGMSFIAGKALCEQPFNYSIIEIASDGTVSIEQEQLRLPEKYTISDCHVHTHFAYCNENMDIAQSIRLGEIFGLKNMVFSEHSAHLYFNRQDYAAKKFYTDGIDSPALSDLTEEYFNLYRTHATERCRLGMEIDVDFRGHPVISRSAWNQLDVKLGAVHFMSALTTQERNLTAIEQEFLFLTESIAKSGIDILAHPFRIFRRNGLPLPENLFQPVAKILKAHNVAAEINFHTNEPSPEFIRICIEHGVKLSFGSDSHNLYEVGEFYPHLKLLEQTVPGFALSDLTIKI